ncbi:hypothetical protein HDU96_002327, partial [Phlyctochytrium bullatum]
RRSDRLLSPDDIKEFMDDKCTQLEKKVMAFRIIRSLKLDNNHGRFKKSSADHLLQRADSIWRDLQMKLKDYDPEKPMTLKDLDLETDFRLFVDAHQPGTGQPLSSEAIGMFLDGKLVELQREAIETERVKANNLRIRLREYFPPASDIIPVFQRRDLRPDIIPLLCLPETETEGVDWYVPYNSYNGADRWYIPQEDVQELVLFNIKTFERRRVMVGKSTLRNVPRFVAISHCWPKDESCLEVEFEARQAIQWSSSCMPKRIRYRPWVLRLLVRIYAALSRVKEDARNTASNNERFLFRDSAAPVDMWATDWIWLDALCSDQWNQLWVRDNTYAMAFVYNAACMTLIMSEEFPSPKARWISRRWTLQEARLSKKLVWCTWLENVGLQLDYNISDTILYIKAETPKEADLVNALKFAISGEQWKLSQGIYYSKLRESYFDQDLVYSIAMMVPSIAGLRMVYDVPVDIVLNRAIAQAASNGDYSAIHSDFNSPTVQESSAKKALEMAFSGQAGTSGLQFAVYKLAWQQSDVDGLLSPQLLMDHFDELFLRLVEAKGGSFSIDHYMKSSIAVFTKVASFVMSLMT